MKLTKKQIFFLGLMGLIILGLVLANIFRVSSLLSENVDPAQLFIPPTVTSTSSPTLTPTVTLTPIPTPEPTATVLPEINGQASTIGYSVQGRPLQVLQFGSGQHHLMIVAGIHGGYESNTVLLANLLVDKLKAKEVVVPADVTLYILTDLNPDGYVRQLGPEGRANADNVDLNRNWDANWKARWYGTQCWSKRAITAGSAPFSEPETLALANFLIDQKIEALISYHSAALGIFPGGNWADESSMALASQLDLVSPYAYPPVNSDCEYTGQLVDWASSKGIAAVDIELRTHDDPDLEINVNVLQSFLNWQTYLTGD
jgi:predicted deacylase